MPQKFGNFFWLVQQEMQELVRLRSWSNDQTLSFKHLTLALQAMFNRFVTSQNITLQAELPVNAFEFQKHLIFVLHEIFDQQCFVVPNSQTFCLTSKSQMFDKQCLIVCAGP